MNDRDHQDGFDGRSTDDFEVTSDDPRYPTRLAALPDPPERLYVRGELPTAPLVGIVGAREADRTSLRLAHDLGRRLAARGFGIVSGGARGVDTAAHQGALAADGITVAVLGAGFDHLYPAANRELFASMAERGAVITEFEPPTPPTRWTFPRRNRVVAALASALVVVQAAERSGALITARIARRLGVPVGAVPGRAGDLGMRGCNQLIRAGAVLVEDAEDVVALLGSEPPAAQLGLPGVDSRGKEQPPERRLDLTDREALVLDKLGAAPSHIDDISAEAGLSAAETTAVILGLELAGIVEDRGGKQFVRVG
jgi:DNA processing protein